jgi:3-hydroxyisobutyrate dehydrogenase
VARCSPRPMTDPGSPDGSIAGPRSSETASVLFVGIGKMGMPMAHRLSEAGHVITVRDIDHAAVARWNDTHKAVRESANIAVLMLPSSQVVEAVLEGPGGGGGGLLGELPPGAVIVDMGSSEPASTVQMAARARQRGLGFVDAPVTGGLTGAQTGRLTIMIGGADGDVARVRPLLATLGSTLLRTGGVGTGHAMKSLNNIVSAAGMLITAEAMTAGVRFGLDPEVMGSILNAGSGRTYASEWKIPQFVFTGTFNSGFALQLMVKDIHTAVAVANAVGSPGGFMQSCAAAWTRAANELPEFSDHTEFMEWVARHVGATLVPAPKLPS